MSDTAPTLTVLMPVYDAERFVFAALESLLRQTHREFELLVFDDASRDRSAAIVESFRDQRIRLFRKPHAGHTVWLREGVERARGTFVARMDADDIAQPQRFERQLDYMRRHPECVAVGADVLLVDPDGRALREQGVRLEHDEIVSELLLGRGGALVHPVAMFRREALVAVGNYRPETEPAEDLDLYLRLAEKGRLANLSDTLLHYRLHLHKVSSARAGEQRRMIQSVVRDARLRRGLSPDSTVELPLVPESLAEIDWWHYWARSAIRGRRFSTACRYAGAALLHRPLESRSWRLMLSALLGARVRRVKGLPNRLSGSLPPRLAPRCERRDEGSSR